MNAPIAYWQTRIELAPDQWLDITPMIESIHLLSGGCCLFHYRPAAELPLREGMTVQTYQSAAVQVTGQVHFITDEAPARFCVHVGRVQITTEVD